MTYIYRDAELSAEIERLRQIIALLEDKHDPHWFSEICFLREQVQLLKMLQIQRKVERIGKVVNFLRWRDGVNERKKQHG